MRWIAVIVLAFVGLVEMIFRLVFVLLCIVSIFGIIVLIDQDDPTILIQPSCFNLARQIAEASLVSPKEIRQVIGERDKLLREKVELQELLLRSEIVR